MEDMDQSLLQDFLTESNELIEQLDADLVRLEDAQHEADTKELLDGVFRALHTIKGAASFLSLNALTTFAHAAEDALNRLRKGEVQITPEVMDAMLRSVDVLRSMLGGIATGQTITPGPADLIQTLHTIAGQSADTEHATDPTGDAPPQAQQEGSNTGGTAHPDGHSEIPLSLPPEKADLLEFMAADLNESIRQIDECLANARHLHSRSDAASLLAELPGPMRQTADFFDLKGLAALTEMLAMAAAGLSEMPDELAGELLVRVEAVRRLIATQADALTRRIALQWPLETLQKRIETLSKGTALPDDVVGQHDGDVDKLLQLDGVMIIPPADTTPNADAPSQTLMPADRKDGAEAKTRTAAVVDQTVRVEVSRLEDLLNLVGQLVLNKNRMVALTRKLREQDLAHEVIEDFTGAASELDRLTGELQVGVMRTRMQPLAKLFDRYPRVIRDIARKTDKQLHLEIVGKETEVDKTVLENLADPLVHILRNSADHGIELPAKRAETGKPEVGTIRLAAEHQGNNVRVEITDDGKGLDRQVIGNKAMERGLVSQDQLASMSDDDIFRFIFAAGFSTAEQVTDLSGRGVGMDVVRTNISKLNGTINVSSVTGQGTTIEVLIPLTVAIMPAMMVRVGEHLYAIPLTNIIEIVRPDASSVYTVKGQPVMRIRDKVRPLMDMRMVLGEPESENSNKFAVVVGVGQQQVGLLVDRLIGQQEVVIKSLDDCYATSGPFSGATIREDGGVSLILDVNQLIRQSQAPERAAA